MEIKTPPTFTDEELKIPEASYLRRTSMTPTEQNRFAPLVLGTLILLLLLVLAGLYYWHALITKTPVVPEPALPAETETALPTEGNNRTPVVSPEIMSTSDELDAIEADLERTNLDNLDTELDELDTELEAANNRASGQLQ